jgi:dipeptidyl aminopeptidase/acylaminoacyl peptidase
MEADGTNVSRLTDNTADDLNPAWSPDGTRIAFVSDRDGNENVYVMDADGAHQTQLTTNPANFRSPGPQIVVMDADGTNEVTLTPYGVWDYDPNWSPDGTMLAFESYVDGNTELYVMAADGTARTRLTTTSAYEMYPTWSPDGARIAYDLTSTSEIHSMRVDGTDDVVVGVGMQPAWSPDGSQLAFMMSVPGGNRIALMDVDGANVVPLTSGFTDQLPAWQRLVTAPAPLLPAVAAGDATVTEGPAAVATIPVTLSWPAAGASSVQWTTVNGSAGAPGDFVASSGIAQFAAGATATTISVPIVDDGVAEAVQSFTVKLSAPSALTIGDTAAKVNVLDDDAPLSLSVRDAWTYERDLATAHLVYRVSLSRAVPDGATVTVTIATSGGTATAATDYAVLPATPLTFAAGEQTKTVAVTVFGDTVPERNETVRVAMTAPHGAVLADAAAIGTNVNDD